MTRARSMNWPKGRPSGEPWKMAMVALFSSAAREGQGGRLCQGIAQFRAGFRQADNAGKAEASTLFYSLRLGKLPA